MGVKFKVFGYTITELEDDGGIFGAAGRRFYRWWDQKIDQPLSEKLSDEPYWVRITAGGLSAGLRTVVAVGVSGGTFYVGDVLSQFKDIETDITYLQLSASSGGGGGGDAGADLEGGIGVGGIFKYGGETFDFYIGFGTGDTPTGIRLKYEKYPQYSIDIMSKEIPGEEEETSDDKAQDPNRTDGDTPTDEEDLPGGLPPDTPPSTSSTILPPPSGELPGADPSLAPGFEYDTFENYTLEYAKYENRDGQRVENSVSSLRSDSAGVEYSAPAGSVQVERQDGQVGYYREVRNPSGGLAQIQETPTEDGIEIRAIVTAPDGTIYRREGTVTQEQMERGDYRRLSTTTLDSDSFDFRGKSNEARAREFDREFDATAPGAETAARGGGRLSGPATDNHDSPAAQPEKDWPRPGWPDLGLGPDLGGSLKGYKPSSDKAPVVRQDDAVPDTPRDVPLPTKGGPGAPPQPAPEARGLGPDPSSRLFANVAFSYDAGPFQTLTPVSYYDTGNAGLNLATSTVFSLYNLATIPLNAAFESLKAISRLDEALGDFFGPDYEAAKNLPILMPVEFASAMAALPAAVDAAMGLLSRRTPVPAVMEGSFSIIESAKYPYPTISTMYGPPASAPYGRVARLLEEQEYSAARQVANRANRIIRRDFDLVGTETEIHENLPIKFGGSPTEFSNKSLLDPAEHRAYSQWWEELQQWIEHHSSRSD